jgi:hypothetical protein
MKTARGNAVIALTPAADYSAKKGYAGTFSSDTFTVSASATTPVTGVIIDGNETTAGYATEKVGVSLLGAVKGTVPMRLGGSVTKGALLIQNSDGTVITDSGSGARVAVGYALETGVSGENIEVAPITPRIYSS